HRRSKRVGRGISAGQGKTAGRGQKGQGSRSSGNVPIGFEGGQMPLAMRLPKLRGFHNFNRRQYATVNLGKLNRFETGTEVVPALRRKILFTAGMIVVFRLLAHLAVPGANANALKALFNSNGLLPLIDLFSGGGLSRFSITAMGVNPYINASIIMQLMTVVSERLKELSKEGEYGRRKITQYTRRLT